MALGTPPKMGEGATVAGPEGAHVHAGGEAAERVPRVRQRHVERVDPADPDVGEDSALLAPVDLGLRPGDHLEPAVQPRQGAVIAGADLGGDPRPGLRDIHLHPLVVAGEAVLGGQPLVDHARPQPDVTAQPGVHHAHERCDRQRLRPLARRRGRRHRRGVRGQVLLDRLPVVPGHPGDLRDTHACLTQRAETTNVHPRLRIQDHVRRSPFGLVCLPADKPKGDQQSQRDRQRLAETQDVRPYTARDVRSYADTCTCPTPRRTSRPSPTRSTRARPNTATGPTSSRRWTTSPAESSTPSTRSESAATQSLYGRPTTAAIRPTGCRPVTRTRSAAYGTDSGGHGAARCSPRLRARTGPRASSAGRARCRPERSATNSCTRSTCSPPWCAPAVAPCRRTARSTGWTCAASCSATPRTPAGTPSYACRATGCRRSSGGNGRSICSSRTTSIPPGPPTAFRTCTTWSGTRARSTRSTSRTPG